MESPQSVISPHRISTMVAAEKPDLTKPNRNQTLSNHHSNNNDKSKNYMGVLNVYIHSARDILNICIYHKQDVYARLSFTHDPETFVNSNIINGGGQNPVFNDQVRLDVATVETSLKCEIWMMSRVRNYLEDQLLGFALIPLSEVLIANGKLEKEFTLSSTDLFHSPAGFVQLSIDYAGAKPAVVITDLTLNADEEISEASPIASELDKIEFPDPKIVNEDEIMVSEYILTNPCNSLDSDAGVNYSAESESTHVVESTDTVEAPKADSPPSIVSGINNGAALSPSDSSEDTASKEKKSGDNDSKESASESSVGFSNESSVIKPVSVAIEPEQKVVQQDIVDMYMKSMQQFTESLAKMKLPLDIVDTSSATTAAEKTDSPTTTNNSDPNAQTPKSNRVFYGSRAFF